MTSVCGRWKSDSAVPSRDSNICIYVMGSNTITHAAYNAGATVTIGTTKSVSHQSANAWIDYFFTCMGIGFDVQTALDEANTFMAESYGAVDSAFCECVFVGDGNFVLP